MLTDLKTGQVMAKPTTSQGNACEGKGKAHAILEYGKARQGKPMRDKANTMIE